jgi:hypothetical protein
VESQLRRELASELHAQAADEVAALRAELAALRTSLEVLFETELDQRPVLETERATTHGDSQRANDSDKTPGEWVSRNRVTSVRAETTPNRAAENSIIDVAEEPVPRQPAADAAEAYRGAETYPLADAFQAPEAESEPDTPRPTSAARPAAPEPQPAAAARHRSTEHVSGDQGPQTRGQSVADLLARLRAEVSGAGRRRRRAVE